MFASVDNLCIAHYSTLLRHYYYEEQTAQKWLILPSVLPLNSQLHLGLKQDVCVSIHCFWTVVFLKSSPPPDSTRAASTSQEPAHAHMKQYQSMMNDCLNCGLFGVIETIILK